MKKKNLHKVVYVYEFLYTIIDIEAIKKERKKHMPMLKDEITVVKSLLIKLDLDHSMLVTYQYHTEPNDMGKVDRSKSKYRWMARVFKTDDLIKKINWMRLDENRLSKFKWPNDPWPWYVSSGYPEHWKIADWLATKLKKIKSWEDGQKFLQGWETKTKHRAEGFNKNAKYEIEGYLDEKGQTVSLVDKAALLKRVGQNLIKVKSKV